MRISTGNSKTEVLGQKSLIIQPAQLAASGKQDAVNKCIVIPLGPYMHNWLNTGT